MELQLQRMTDDGKGTIGILSVQHNAVRAPNTGYRMENLVTLEDTFHDKKIVHETRIPGGRYKILRRPAGAMHQKYTRRFGDNHRGMFHLQHVPGFTWVYIHIGNDPDDTSGCILVGMGSSTHSTIHDSTTAYIKLADAIHAAWDRGEEVWITVKDELKSDLMKHVEEQQAANRVYADRIVGGTETGRVRTSPFPFKGDARPRSEYHAPISDTLKRLELLERVVKQPIRPQLPALDNARIVYLEDEFLKTQGDSKRFRKQIYDQGCQIRANGAALGHQLDELKDSVADLTEDDEATDKQIGDLAEACLLLDKESKQRDIEINKRLNNQRQYLDKNNSRISEVEDRIDMRVSLTTERLDKRTARVDGELEKAVTRIDSLDQRSNTLVNRIDALVKQFGIQLDEDDGAVCLRLKAMADGLDTYGSETTRRFDHHNKRLDTQAKALHNRAGELDKRINKQRIVTDDLERTVGRLDKENSELHNYMDAMLMRLRQLEENGESMASAIANAATQYSLDTSNLLRRLSDSDDTIALLVGNVKALEERNAK